VNDLSNIQSQLIYSQWQTKGSLPESLTALNDSISGYMVPTDPETGAAYGYTKTASTTFELCADFALSSIPMSDTVAGRLNREDATWNHKAGHSCFNRTIDPEQYPIYPKPVTK
jgi:hypothetical protein